MEWKLRKAVREDEGRIRELFVEMLRAIHPGQDVHGYENGYLGRFWEAGEDWICVATAEEDLVAYLSMEVHHEEEDFIYLDDFSVSAAYRGRGIGTQLLKTAEAFAREADISVLVLHVEKSNQGALRLYQWMGYSVMSDEGTRFRMIKRLF